MDSSEINTIASSTSSDSISHGAKLNTKMESLSNIQDAEDSQTTTSVISTNHGVTRPSKMGLSTTITDSVSTTSQTSNLNGVTTPTDLTLMKTSDTIQDVNSISATI